MGSYKKVRWVMSTAFRFCSVYFVSYALILIFTATLGLIINLVNKTIVNELSDIAGRGIISVFFVEMVIVYMCLYFLQRANGFIITFGSNFFQYRVDMLFHKIFMWKAYRTPQKRFLNNDFMDQYSYIGGNTGKIGNYYKNLFTVIFVSAVTVVGTLILFVIYEPWLIVYAMLIAFLTFKVNAYVARKEYDLEKRKINEQRFHDYYKSLLTGKENAKEIRIYKSQSYLYEKWIKVYEKLRSERLSLAIKKDKLENIYSFVRFFCRIIAIVLLMIGTYYKKYDIGTFVLLFGLIENCANQVDQFSSVIAKGAYKDVKYLLDYYDFIGPLSREEVTEALKDSDDSDDLYFGEFKELTLSDVSFSYTDNECFAVKKVSLRIQKGETISILGYNGSGKTTLSKILSGSLKPFSGKITINNIEINDENRRFLFSYFGFMAQEFSKYSVSIHDYVGLGRIEWMNNEEAIKAAYSKASSTEFIYDYPSGDKTMLGKEYDDNGVDLSGGEWQKLAIASAYMGDPQVLLMDEPTASIDPLKEAEFIENFSAHLKCNTAILISHRIGFARLADRIIMMEDGQISEQGSHEELLDNHGYYWKLFDAQKKLYNGEKQI